MSGLDEKDDKKQASLDSVLFSRDESWQEFFIEMNDYIRTANKLGYRMIGFSSTLDRIRIALYDFDIFEEFMASNVRFIECERQAIQSIRAQLKVKPSVSDKFVLGLAKVLFVSNPKLPAKPNDADIQYLDDLLERKKIRFSGENNRLDQAILFKMEECYRAFLISLPLDVQQQVQTKVRTDFAEMIAWFRKFEWMRSTLAVANSLIEHHNQYVLATFPANVARNWLVKKIDTFGILDAILPPCIHEKDPRAREFCVLDDLLRSDVQVNNDRKSSIYQITMLELRGAINLSNGFARQLDNVDAEILLRRHELSAPFSAADKVERFDPFGPGAQAAQDAEAEQFHAAEAKAVPIVPERKNNPGSAYSHLTGLPIRPPGLVRPPPMDPMMAVVGLGGGSDRTHKCTCRNAYLTRRTK